MHIILVAYPAVKANRLSNNKTMSPFSSFPVRGISVDRLIRLNLSNFLVILDLRQQSDYSF